MKYPGFCRDEITCWFQTTYLTWRLWVRIPSKDPGRVFFTFICCKNCLETQKIKEIEEWPIYNRIFYYLYKHKTQVYVWQRGDALTSIKIKAKQ